MSSNESIPYIIRMGSGLGYNTPNHVLFASLFGGPSAGLWLMSKNARNFGDAKTASLYKWAGAAVMPAAYALFPYVLHTIPPLLVSAILAAALRQYCVMKQAKKIEKYAQEGYYKSPLPNLIFTTAASLVILLFGCFAFNAEYFIEYKNVPLR